MPPSSVMPAVSLAPLARSRFVRRLLPAVVLLALADLQAARAAGDEIGRVEVTGVSSTSRLGNGARYELDGADLAAEGVATLDQALARVPGLNVRTGADGVPRIDIRGLRTRHVRLLIDGVPVNAAADGQFDPTLIPVALIERVVVHTGAASVLYGEGGLAGTIEVVTRRGQGPAAGAAWLQAGSGHGRLAGAQLAGAQGEWDYALGVEWAEQDGFRLASDAPTSAVQPGGLRANSDLRRLNAVARLGWQATDTLRLALQLTGTGGDRGAPPSAIDDTADVFAQRPRWDRTENLRGASAQLSAQWTASADTLVRGWVYRRDQQQDERRYDNAALALLQDRTLRGGYELQTDNRSDGAHLQASTALAPTLSLSVAADTRRERFDQSGRIRDVAVTSGGSGNGGGAGRGGGGGLVTGYELRAVDTAHAASVDSLAAELGWQLRPATQLGLGVGRVQQRREADRRGGNLWSLDARHAVTDAVALKAGWAQRVRAPSVSQLYDASAGNPALALERLRVVEAGVEWSLPRGPAVQATVFRQRVRDLIRNDDATGRAANLDRVDFRGLELQARWQATPALQLVPAYTWLDSRNASPGAAFETPAYTPRHKLGLDARWQAQERLTLGGNLLHVRGQAHDSRTGPPRQAELPSYTLLSLYAGWKLDPVLLTLRVDNALDRQYATSYGFWQPGRMLSLRGQVAF